MFETLQKDLIDAAVKLLLLCIALAMIVAVIAWFGMMASDLARYWRKL
jgi:hypothetical protein